jgi:hypothetical protein
MRFLALTTSLLGGCLAPATPGADGPTPAEVEHVGGAAPDTAATADTGSDTGAPDAPGYEVFLFGGAGLPRVDLTLPEDSVTVLTAAPRAWVPADLSVLAPDGAVALTRVGVRLKGVYGSFRGLDAKAAFLVDTDAFVEDAHLHGLTKLALNNMVQDPSMIHEVLAYRLFRAMGVPAPLAAHVEVRVNGAPWGLYTAVEPADNDAFATRWFGDEDAVLYEGAYGSDLEAALVTSFDHDHGPDSGFTDLVALVRVLDAVQGGDTLLDELDPVLDVDTYLRFAATELYLGHWDGYAWSRNNYHLAWRPSDGRWVFLPWGLDQTFVDGLDPWSGGGRLHQMCMASRPCRAAFADALREVIDTAARLDLAGEARVLVGLLDAAVRADTRKELDDASVFAWMENTAAFVEWRDDDLLARLACADPDAVDADGDGANGCGVDCDDGNPTRYPGAPEACNLFDDDCDGTWDEDSDCPTCVESGLPDGTVLARCFQARPWADAEADCVAQGGHLLSLHDEGTHAVVLDAAWALGLGTWWIGASDLAEEGAWAWSDGSPMDYAPWAGGQPDDYAGMEECATIVDWAGGAWNDLDCAAPAPYLCALPPPAGTPTERR